MVDAVNSSQPTEPNDLNVSYKDTGDYKSTLNGLFHIGLEFLYGISDSLKLKKVLEFVLISNLIKSLLFKTFMINGVLIVGSTFILNIFSNSAWVQSMRQRELAQTIFSILYHLLYLYPLFIGSLLINSFDYMDMAAEALKLEKKVFRNRGVTDPSADVLTRIYNEVINALFLVFFLLQSFVLSFVPYVGPIISLLSQSFVYAFYCFTYKWGTDQVDLFKILAFFEKHFFYFSGFGFVYAIITRIFPGLMGSAVYAALFPVFLLLSIKASPPRDLKVDSVEEFLNHAKSMFKKKKQDRPVIEYDYIDTFNYQEFCKSLKNKIGIFIFPLMGINFVGSYLNKKVNFGPSKKGN